MECEQSYNQGLLVHFLEILIILVGCFNLVKMLMFSLYFLTVFSNDEDTCYVNV